MTTIHKPQHTGLPIRAQKALEFIIRYKVENDGNSPNMREIGEAIGVKSTSLIDYYLRRLEEAGCIRERQLWRSRQIQLVGGE